MRLYVMRHGPAEDRAPTGRDFDRALTSAGREVVARAARALRGARAEDPLRILSSPFRRARETAEVVASLIAPAPPEVEIVEDLAADEGVPLALVRTARAAGADTLLVGHQPIVEELVRVLVHPARPSFPSGFRTATIVVLDDATHHGGAQGGAEDRFHLATIVDPYHLPHG